MLRSFKQVYESDSLTCPKCGRDVELIAFLTEPASVKPVHLGLPAEPPPVAPRRTARRPGTSTRAPPST